MSFWIFFVREKIGFVIYCLGMCLALVGAFVAGGPESAKEFLKFAKGSLQGDTDFQFSRN